MLNRHLTISLTSPVLFAILIHVNSHIYSPNTIHYKIGDLHALVTLPVISFVFFHIIFSHLYIMKGDIFFLNNQPLH